MSLRSSLGASFLLCTCALAGCPGDDSGDTAGDTHDHGAADTNDHDHGADTAGTASTSGTASTASTASTSGTSGTASTSGTATTDPGHDHGIDTGADDQAGIYCNCVFINCHEPYHAKWGDDEMAAQEACLLEADGLPVNGSDIDMGNFIECRQHFCDAAANDATLCANALGDAVCI